VYQAHTHDRHETGGNFYEGLTFDATDSLPDILRLIA
jgi:hypothetical protein